MSHITRIKTKIVEKEFLLKALTDLGYQFQVGDFSISGFADQKARVEIKISLPLSRDIGLRKNDDHFEIVADWFGVIGVNKEKFINQLNQRYAYQVARSRLEEQGFSLIEEKSEEKGQIRLILRRLNG